MNGLIIDGKVYTAVKDLPCKDCDLDLKCQAVDVRTDIRINGTDKQPRQMRPLLGRERRREMNKLNPNQWWHLLNQFTYCGDKRPGLTLPFEQDDYIYATNTYIIIRVRKDIVPKGDCDYSPKGRVVNCQKAFYQPDPTFTISAKDIETAFVKLGIDPNVIDSVCPECGGEGEVDWEYTDRNGKQHTLTYECPLCGGVCTIPNGIDCWCGIDGKETLANNILMAYHAMLKLGIDTVRCTKGRTSLMMSLADGIDILTVMIDPSRERKSKKIKINKI